MRSLLTLVGVVGISAGEQPGHLGQFCCDPLAATRTPAPARSSGLSAASESSCSTSAVSAAGGALRGGSFNTSNFVSGWRARCRPSQSMTSSQLDRRSAMDANTSESCAVRIALVSAAGLVTAVLWAELAIRALTAWSLERRILASPWSSWPLFSWPLSSWPLSSSRAAFFAAAFFGCAFFAAVLPVRVAALPSPLGAAFFAAYRYRPRAARRPASRRAYPGTAGAPRRCAPAACPASSPRPRSAETPRRRRCPDS